MPGCFESFRWFNVRLKFRINSYVLLCYPSEKPIDHSVVQARLHFGSCEDRCEVTPTFSTNI